MKNESPYTCGEGLKILARIIARKFMADQRDNKEIEFGFGDKPDVPLKHVLNKKGEAVTI